MGFKGKEEFHAPLFHTNIFHRLSLPYKVCMCVCPLTRAALHVFPLERLTALYRAAGAERTK